MATAPRADRAPALLALLAAIAFFTALVAPALDPARQLFYRDTGRLYYPVKQFIAAELHQGRLPLWDPWTEAGTSLLAQVTPGLLHPFTLLYLLAPFELAFKLNHLLALPFAGLGAYLLSRKLGAGRSASLAACFLYGGSGYLVSVAATNLPYALGAATVPLALWAFLRLLERPSPARLAAACALLALCALAGEPESMLFAGLLGGVWAGARALAPSAASPAGASRGRALSRALGLAAVWGLLALALSGPAALPALARLRGSERAEGISAQQRRIFSLHPARLAGLAIARAFDDLERGSPPSLSPWFSEYFSSGGSSFAASIALGAPGVLLALCALFAGRRGRFLLAGALLFLLGATGERLGFGPLFAALVPGLRFFRYSEKLVAPATLLIALAAALGAEFTLGASSTKRRALALAATSLALGSACLLFPLDALRQPLLSASGPRPAEAAAHFLAALRSGLLVSGALWLLLGALALARAAGARAHTALALASALCAAAVLDGSAGLLLTAPLELLQAPLPLADELLARAGPSPGRWRLIAESGGAYTHGRTPEEAVRDLRLGLEPQLEQLSQIEGVGGYFSDPDLDFEGALRADPDDVLAVLHGRFTLLHTASLEPAMAAQLGFVRASQGSWLRERATLPPAFVTGGAALYGALAEPRSDAIAALRRPGFDPGRTALLAAGDREFADGLPPSGAQPASAAQLDAERPDRARVRVDSSGGILVVGDHFDPGWRARLDGAPVPVARVDLVALGVRVPPGVHQLELEFWPAGLTAGLLACGAALLVLFALQLASWVRLARR